MRKQEKDRLVRDEMVDFERRKPFVADCLVILGFVAVGATGLCLALIFICTILGAKWL